MRSSSIVGVAVRTSRTVLLSMMLVLSGCTSSGVEAIDSSAGITTASIVRPDRAVGQAPVIAPAEQKESMRAERRDAQEEKLLALLNQPVTPRAEKALTRLAVHKPKFSDAKPINFGKTEPDDYAVHGVDVSRWQGDIDWVTLRKQGANFAWIKATDGTDHLDPKFMDNWKGAAAAGIPRGAYHFFYWCSVSEVQADWFIANVPKEKGALPPVLDVEWNAHSKTCNERPDQATVLAKMQVFLDKLEKHYGQQPVIYTAPDFYDANLRGKLTNYTFWLRSVAAHPSSVYPGRAFGFWQYSGTGMADGVDHKIDLNVFNGTKESWARWLKQRTR